MNQPKKQYRRRRSVVEYESEVPSPSRWDERDRLQLAEILLEAEAEERKGPANLAEEEKKQAPTADHSSDKRNLHIVATLKKHVEKSLLASIEEDQ